MAAALTDQGWTDICAAAGRTPGDEVRAELSATLYDEYPGFAYDRERRARVLASADRAERMLKHLDAFAADHREQFPRADEIKTERDRFYIERLRWRALAVLDDARALSHAHGGHSNVQQEMLYTRLCTIWLYGFGKPKLTTTRGGPLVRFILACMRQIIPEDALPDPERVREAIIRQRNQRALLWDGVRELRGRDRGA